MAKTKDPELERRRKAQILETACRLLESDSHRALTLERVAREAGVSKGMVTYYFRNKDQLISEAIELWLERQHQALEAIVRSDAPLAERVKLLIQTALPSRSQLEREIQLQAEVWSFAKQAPQAREAIQQSYLGFRRACERMLEVGVAEGYVTAPDARWLYLLLHALIDGVAVQLVVDESLDIAEVRQRVFLLVDSLLTARPGSG